MYRNIGGKIKVLAAIIGWVCLAAGVILWLVGISGNSYIFEGFVGWLCLLAGVILFMMTWVLYGFGQLVQDTREIKETMSESAKDAKKSPSNDSLPEL